MLPKSKMHASSSAATRRSIMGSQRGDALRILERDAGIKTAELKEIRRQTNADLPRGGQGHQ